MCIKRVRQHVCAGHNVSVFAINLQVAVVHFVPWSLQTLNRHLSIRICGFPFTDSRQHCSSPKTTRLTITNSESLTTSNKIKQNLVPQQFLPNPQFPFHVNPYLRRFESALSVLGTRSLTASLLCLAQTVCTTSPCVPAPLHALSWYFSTYSVHGHEHPKEQFSGMTSNCPTAWNSTISPNLGPFPLFFVVL